MPAPRIAAEPRVRLDAVVPPALPLRHVGAGRRGDRRGAPQPSGHPRARRGAAERPVSRAERDRRVLRRSTGGSAGHGTRAAVRGRLAGRCSATRLGLRGPVRTHPRAIRRPRHGRERGGDEQRPPRRRRGRARLWTGAEWLLCEVADRGSIADPLADRRPPRLAQRGGRGLWIANQICELVQVRSSNDGTVVRLHLRRG